MSPLEHFWKSDGWGLGRVVALALGCLSLTIPVLVVYRSIFSSMDPRMERSVLVTLILVYVFLLFPVGRKWSDRFKWRFLIDALLIVLAVTTGLYTIWGTEVEPTTSIRVSLFGTPVRLDHIAGIIVVALVLEGTRRSFGWALTILSLAFLAYSLTASYFPGPLRGARATWTYLTEMLYVIDQGVYGVGASTLVSTIFPYLLFGSLLVETKTGTFFTALANGLVGRYAGGPAKAAIVASAAVGMISGSAVANVVTAGSVTIPLMKSIGYSPVFAAAVESCASSAGYFTPPVMGAAAFLIASFTNTPYLKVCLYAAIPAALFFYAVFVQVHLRARRLGLSGMPEEALPSPGRVLMEGGYLVLPLVIIVIGLMIGRSATAVAIWGLVAIVLLSFVRKETRQDPFSFMVLFDRAVLGAASIAMGVIAVGIVQGALMASGLGMKLSFIVETLSAGNLFLGLILAAIVTIILGMGVNPMLVYFIAYIFIIPGLVRVGAPVMSAHMFALIYGAVANITPPVCMASFAAAAIAGAPAMRVGFEASKLGFAAFLVPFLLVLHPALILENTTVMGAVIALSLAVVGIGVMAASFEGYLLKKASVPQRIVLLAAGMLTVAPSLPFAVCGLGLIVAVALWQKLHKEGSREGNPGTEAYNRPGG